MKVSIDRIKNLNDKIGLGLYGSLSSIRYKIALNYILDLCVENKKICEIGPGGVIFYIAEYSNVNTSAIVSPREHHWDKIFENYGVDHFEWDLNAALDLESLQGSFDCIIFWKRWNI